MFGFIKRKQVPMAAPAAPAPPSSSGGLQRATFAAGCFWGVEAAFRELSGIAETEVGYTGGTQAHPTYRNVCGGRTGHAEAVGIWFDPALISYNELLSTFWSIHNPTTANRQGPDVGSQYRSAIFFHSAAQEATAQRSRSEQQPNLRRPIVTEITSASAFYRAEDFHQRYLEKSGTAACAVQLRQRA